MQCGQSTPTWTGLGAHDRHVARAVPDEWEITGREVSSHDLTLLARRDRPASLGVPAPQAAVLEPAK